MKLTVGDAGGADGVDVYVDGARAALPSAVLPGSLLQISHALWVRAKGSGKLYLKLDEDSAVVPLWSPCTDDFCASTSTDGAGGDGEVASRAALLASCSADAMLCELAPTERGKKLARRVLRLRLTLKTISEIHVKLRCSACGAICCGRRCLCASGQRPLSFEVEMECSVADGSGKGYLKATGTLVWALLQSSSSMVRDLRGVAAASGPLSCKPTQGYGQCLREGRGQWFCGAGQILSAADKRVLTTLWDAAAHAQREFVVHARVVRMANTAAAKRGSIQVSREAVPTLFPEAAPTLVACHVDPLRPCDELLRLLSQRV